MKLPEAPILVMVATIEPALEFKVWQAIQGGLDMLILRAKVEKLEAIKTTLSILRTALGSDFPIFVNSGDRSTNFAQASGYHWPEAGAMLVAQETSAIGEKLRALLRERTDPIKHKVQKGLGVSVHSVEAAVEAGKLFPDYLLVGTIFDTPSHKGEKPGGIEHLSEICKATNVPVVAIGGITPKNAGECIKAGAIGVAAMSPFKGAGRQELAKAYKEAMR